MWIICCTGIFTVHAGKGKELLKVEGYCVFEQFWLFIENWWKDSLKICILCCLSRICIFSQRRVVCQEKFTYFWLSLSFWGYSFMTVTMRIPGIFYFYYIYIYISLRTLSIYIFIIIYIYIYIYIYIFISNQSHAPAHSSYWNMSGSYFDFS